MNPVAPQLEGAWFQPLRLYSENLVSKFALRIRLVPVHLENISLDNLARLLVDVHIDSSKIMESLLSSHQRDLLDMIFLGNTLNRDKVNVIIADRVVPKQSAERYLDKDAFENEIKQVLGDTYEAHDLGDNDIVITGSHGIMLVGPQSKMQEPVMLAFLSLRSRDVFVHNVFNRLFIIDDTLKTARQLIAKYEQDPNSIPRIRHTLSETSKDIILLEEVLLYLAESLEQDTSIWAEPVDDAGHKLYQVLKVKTILNDLQIRITDMKKVLLGARHEVNGLRQMTDTIAETQMFRLQEEIRGNSSDMLQQLKINERQSTSLDVMQVIFAGSLAFEILDRLTAGAVQVCVWNYKKRSDIFSTETTDKLNSVVTHSFESAWFC